VAADNDVVFVGDCNVSEQWFKAEADDANNGRLGNACKLTDGQHGQ